MRCIKQTCQPSGWWNLKSTTVRTPYRELLCSSQQCSYFVSFRSPWFLCFMSAASSALIVDAAAKSCGYPHLEWSLPEEGLFKLCRHRGCDHSKSAFHWNPQWCSCGGRRRIRRRLLPQTLQAPEVELGLRGRQSHVSAIGHQRSTAACMTGRHTRVLPWIRRELMLLNDALLRWKTVGYSASWVKELHSKNRQRDLEQLWCLKSGSPRGLLLIVQTSPRPIFKNEIRKKKKDKTSNKA